MSLTSVCCTFPPTSIPTMLEVLTKCCAVTQFGVLEPPVSDTQNRTGIGSDFWEGNWNWVSKPRSVLEPGASKTGPSSKPQTGILEKYLGKMVWNWGFKHQF